MIERILNRNNLSVVPNIIGSEAPSVKPVVDPLGHIQVSSKYLH